MTDKTEDAKASKSKAPKPEEVTEAIESAQSETVEDPAGTPKPGLEKSPAVAGAEQVQEAVDKEHEQGFRGVKADDTPNEHYTVAGVTAGKPTPETDEDHAEWVRQQQRARLKGQL